MEQTSFLEYVFQRSSSIVSSFDQLMYAEECSYCTLMRKFLDSYALLARYYRELFGSTVLRYWRMSETL